MLSPFLSAVVEPDRGLISPQRVSAALNIPLTRLAELAHVHRNTLTRNPEAPLVQERLGEVARIVAAAAELTGDQGRAVVWFRHQPLAGFGGATAEELVAEGQARAVLEHLAMLRDGGYA